MHSNIWLFSSLAIVHTTQIPLMDCIYVTLTKNRLAWFELFVWWQDKSFWGFVMETKFDLKICIYFFFYKNLSEFTDLGDVFFLFL